MDLAGHCVVPQPLPLCVERAQLVTSWQQGRSLWAAPVEAQRCLGHQARNAGPRRWPRSNRRARGHPPPTEVARTLIMLPLTFTHLTFPP